MSGKFYAISLLAVLAMLGAALAPAALHANVWNANGKQKNLANDSQDDNDHDNDNETHENETRVIPSIGGGGWFAVTVGSTTYKDTFGMFISGDSSVPSEFVLQGRDASVRVHSWNFTKISFANNNTTVNAMGWCTVNGAGGYWFNLTAMDLGDRHSDKLQLTVYKDSNNNSQMDETTPAYQWTVNGLGGGQIASASMEEFRDDSEDQDDDHEDDDEMNDGPQDFPSLK
jgi:hypothetical protein